ncbi:MAG: hypothetical protein IT442_04630 [Phycisphaeraceae bacterium]|nr:hypothetical protein [Phycisphaeraceae bacterium]
MNRNYLFFIRRPARLTRAGLLLASLFLALGQYHAQQPAPAKANNAPADPASVDDSILAEERWQEQAHGLSLRPPLGAKLQQSNSADALVVIAGPDGYSIELYYRQIKPGEQIAPYVTSDADNPRSSQLNTVSSDTVQLDIQAVEQMALHQVSTAHPDAVQIDRGKFTVGDDPGSLLYFRLVNQDRSPWVLGHAYLLLDPQTFVMLRMLAPETKFKQVRPVFEAVARSIAVEDPALRDRIRKQQVQQGADWMQSVTPDRIAKSLLPEQWFRMLHDGKDVGYLRINQRPGKRLSFDGVEVQIQSRVEIDRQTIDTLSTMFLSTARDYEDWSTKTTVRPLTPPAAPKGNAPPAPESISAAETGVRTKGGITVTRQNVTGTNKYTWDVPPEGYLPQVLVHLMPALLPRDKPATMGFYAYYPASGEITYRTVEVQPTGKGGIQLVSQPSPSVRNESAEFDAAGRLLKRDMPEGGTVIPATRQQIAAIWKGKLPASSAPFVAPGSALAQ